MKMVIFTEAGFEYGFGHFYRMSGICERAIRTGNTAEMYLRADEAAKSNLKRDYVIFADWKDPEEYRKILGPDVTLVIDSYHVEISELESFRALCRDMVVIDDNIRLDYHDMKILNPNFFAVWLDYPADRGNTVFVGKDCTLLRDEFVMKEDRTAAREVSDILITMGGTDPKGLTPGLIEAVREVSADVNLHVVCTNAYPDLERIRSMLSEQDKLYINIAAEDMCGLMRNCDFAIASAGGTTNELIKMQCPAVLVVVADNQLLNTRFLSENGFVESVYGDDMSVIREMFSYEKRAAMMDKLRTFRSDRSGKDLLCEIAFGGSNE